MNGKAPLGRSDRGGRRRTPPPRPSRGCPEAPRAARRRYPRTIFFSQTFSTNRTRSPVARMDPRSENRTCYRLPPWTCASPHEDEAFRAEARALARREPRGRFRARCAAAAGPATSTRCSSCAAPGSGALARGRLDLPRLAEGARRARRARSRSRSSSTRSTRARAAPGRLGHIGEELLGPTLIAFGTEAQKRRFLPPIRARRGAVVPGLLRAQRRHRDLANVQTRAERDGDAVGRHRAEDLDLARAPAPTGASSSAAPTPSAPKHKGLSYLLVPMRQPGIEVRPDRADDRHVRVQRGVLRRRAHRRGQRRRRGERRLAVAMGDAGVRARRSTLGAAARVRERARRGHRASRRRTARRSDPLHARSASRRRGSG